MVMILEDIKKLAELSRIDMTEDEMKGLIKDFDSILAYVGQVQEVSKLGKKEALHENPDNYFLQNVMREDVATNESAKFKDDILSNSPEIQDGYFKVKQIL
jgi:aspartyl-tRNA(Asn)/glutamyl-tRNA(Gln) amidotransferase subunit C